MPNFLEIGEPFLFLFSAYATKNYLLIIPKIQHKMLFIRFFFGEGGLDPPLIKLPSLN